MGQDYEEYECLIHRSGRIMLTIGSILMLLAPQVFAWILHTSIDWNGFLKGFLRIGPTYWAISIVEFFVYIPLLGAGGSYLTNITGNVINMKLPCAFTAKEIAKTEAGTPENNIVSTIAVATSSLVTMLVIFIGVVALIPLTPILESPVLAPAFANILPSLFGALAAQYFVKSWRITFIPLLLMLILYIAVPSLTGEASTMMIPSGAIAIGIAYLFFKQDKLERKKEAR